MKSKPSKLQEHFTLDFVADRLQGFLPPTAEFNPRADWDLTYGVYTFAGVKPGTNAGHRTATLRIRRSARVAGGSVLNLNYDKILPGGCMQKVTAEMHCRDDVLGTPQRWTYASEVFDRPGQPLAGSRLKKSAAARDGQVEIHDGKHTRRIALDGAFAINWALLEAIGRLPREAFEPLRFTMLDHFDQVKANQTLSYRETVEVLFGERRDRSVRLHAYDQLGEGIVPWVYWIDDRGRLLFAIAGLEAYVLDVVQKS